jgi:hypothetical protein
MGQLSLEVVDIQLPSVPQQDAALSNQALAEKVHVSPHLPVPGQALARCGANRVANSDLYSISETLVQ